MISRIVDCNVQKENLDQFKSTLTEQFLPRIKQQPGFVDLVESCDENGHFVCMTLWRSKADVERYDNELFGEIANALVPLMAGNPNVSTLSVENATSHGVQRGQAAAA
jgi:quinol monooxygenase YgiN